MRVAITADRILTGALEDSIIRDGTILIDGNEIREVGPAEDVRTDDVDRTIDLPGHSLMPGIIDSHTHITYPGADPRKQADLVTNTPSERTIRTLTYARETVNAGITTIRDHGSPLDIAIAVRDAIAAGEFVGPRMFAAGEGLTITGGHGDWVPWYIKQHLNVEGGAIGSKGVVVDGVPEILRAVRAQIEKGADFIKVWASGGVTDVDGGATQAFSREELAAIVAEADRQGVTVSAHAHFPEAIAACVEAGVHSIEHGMFMDDDSIAEMAENGVYLTLTMSSMIALMTMDGIAQSVRETAGRAVENQRSNLASARDAGVRVTMGTDAGASSLAHGDNANELLHMVEAGIDPIETIHISTKQTAEMIGLDTLGLIEPGYIPDVIAVSGNPIDDMSLVTASDNIPLVVVNGNVVKDETETA